MRFLVERFRVLVAAFVLGTALFVSAVPAQADTPAHTDVMFVFDTTGSMGGAIEEGREEIQEAMAQLSASLPDVQFGLAEASDYNEVISPGGFEYGTGEGFAPWTLHSPIGSSQAQVSEELSKLEADGGGDSPEAYGRALFETDTNPAVGWRPDARGVIVLVADDVPHDNDLNEGIPPEAFATESPFDTGVDPGRDNTVGTSDDLDWQNVVLQRLITDGRPLEYVDYFGTEEYVPYWENWTGRTGGSVIQAGEEEKLGEKIVEAVKAGAVLPPCPSGQARDAADHCVTPSPPPSPPSSPPSDNFKFEPRISCSKGCHVVLVKITFDSSGNVIGESIPEEEGATSSATISVKGKAKGCAKGKGKKNGCKRSPLIKQFSQPVVAGVNTLSLKLTGAAIKTLNKKGKVHLKVRFTFTPNGGTAKTLEHTYTVKLPKKGKKHGHAKGK